MREQMTTCFLALTLCIAAPGFPSAIHDAARAGDLEMLRSLLASEPSLLNAKDDIGHTPLTLSAAYARWDLFRFLLEAGADVTVITRTNATALHTVCYHDRADMVELLLQHGGAPNLTVRDIFGEYSPMLRAVQRGNGNVITLLLAKGARTDETTREGWNALHLAAKCGHRHLYGMLIEAGVSLDARDKEGRTPMAYDWRRPDPIPLDPRRLKEYVGRYNWQSRPEGPGVNIFLRDGELMLDDNGLDTVHPIAEDTFYCSHNPWKVTFSRDEAGAIDRVELVFLRRTVVLARMP